MIIYDITKSESETDIGQINPKAMMHNPKAMMIASMKRVNILTRILVLVSKLYEFVLVRRDGISGCCTSEMGGVGWGGVGLGVEEF